MKHGLGIMGVICLALVLLASVAFAGIADTINYQGRLENSGGIPINGTVSMTLAIYNAPSGGTALWTETQSSVIVTDGAFSVALGSVTSLTGLPFDEPYFLGVTVNGDAEMTPRAALRTVPYAARAAFADDADTIDEMEAAEIIDAASDEVRTPISSLPFYVNTPGSYYLTGDLALANTSWDGITVNTDNVTIDLGGFSISGPGTGSGTGINMYGRQNVEVRNGTVRQFGYRGISDGSSASRGHRIIDVRVEDNKGAGIVLSGYDGGHLVKDVTVIGNTGYGIFLYNGSAVYGCVVSNNGDAGIYVNNDNTLRDNIVHQNGNFGIYAYDGSVVTGNNVHNNAGDGIHVGLNATVVGNKVDNNVINGIATLDGSLVTGNSVFNNESNGIWAGNGSTVAGNTSYSNEYGILAEDGSTVKDNTTYLNQCNGIYITGNSLVVGNTAYDNNQGGLSCPNIFPCATCTMSLNHAP